MLSKLKDVAIINRFTYPEVLMKVYETERNVVYMPTYYSGNKDGYAIVDISSLSSEYTYYELSPNLLHAMDSAVCYALIFNSGIFKTYIGKYANANRRVLVKMSVLAEFEIPYIDDVELQAALDRVERTIEHLSWCKKQGLSLSYAELKMSTFELLREALVWSLYCQPIMEQHQLHILSEWKNFFQCYNHIHDINAFADEVLQQFILYEHPLKSEILMVSYIEPELKSYYISQL